MGDEGSSSRFILEVSEHELTLINNALNEVCNGVRIADGEFHSRLGGTREEARAVLRRVNELLSRRRA